MCSGTTPPTLEGPAWTEEGGGRAGLHLVVINKAGATELPPNDHAQFERKHANFKEGALLSQPDGVRDPHTPH